MPDHRPDDTDGTADDLAQRLNSMLNARSAQVEARLRGPDLRAAAAGGGPQRLAPVFAAAAAVLVVAGGVTAVSLARPGGPTPPVQPGRSGYSGSDPSRASVPVQPPERPGTQERRPVLPTLAPRPRISARLQPTRSSSPVSSVVVRSSSAPLSSVLRGSRPTSVTVGSPSATPTR